MSNYQPDYCNGKIYFLSSDLDPRIYIGSTTLPLNARMNLHRYEARRGRVKSKLYQTMDQVGVDSYRIDLMIECPCDSREELESEEYDIMGEFEQEDLLNADIVLGKRVAIAGSRHGRWKGGWIRHDKKSKGFNVRWSVNGVPDSHFISYGPRSNRTQEEALQAAVGFKRNLFRSEDSEDEDSD